MTVTPPVDTVQDPNKTAWVWPQNRLGQAVTAGFAMALVMWTTWFITHLPWADLPGEIQVGIVLAVWIGAATILSASGTILSSLGAGLTSSILGLLLLGSKLVAPAAANQPGAIKPHAAFIAIGFLALGGAVGLAGYFISRLGPKPSPDARPDWLSRFAIVTALAVAVLLFIGGLVTSTNSGMAVPDWPRTYGANMFLYPLSGAAADIFLEHSHRLFGTLVGLCTITLLIWTFIAESRKWVKVIAAIILAIVIAQGVLGGRRVIADSRLLAMFHGVLGQLTFALIVAMAAFLSPTFKRRPDHCDCGYPLEALIAGEGKVICPECGAVRLLPGVEELARPRRLRGLTTAFLHATLLQLIFGAMYRHFRDNHSLMTHLGFSIVVVAFAALAAFCARAVSGHHGGIGPVLRRTGAWILGVITLQFILGWIAFLAGGRDIKAAGAPEALIRTIHQANGALVLALAVLAFTWTRRLLRGSTKP